MVTLYKDKKEGGVRNGSEYEIPPSKKWLEVQKGSNAGRGLGIQPRVG